jgi:hypothetical protein
MEPVTLTETGVYLSNQRGHYISRDIIDLATGYGFIIGSFEQFAVSVYDQYTEFEDYPSQAIYELADEAIEWLNSGQDDCPDCTDGFLPTKDWWTDKDGKMRCKTCSGQGRGPRMEHQNFPPRTPEGYSWALEEGELGLWIYDQEGELFIEE